MKKPGGTGFDRVHNIKPLLAKISQNCLTQYNTHRQVSVEEEMVGLKGRGSLKQYTPLKPTKQGHKIWCLCDSTNGCMCHFEVYWRWERHIHTL